MMRLLASKQHTIDAVNHHIFPQATFDELVPLLFGRSVPSFSPLSSSQVVLSHTCVVRQFNIKERAGSRRVKLFASFFAPCHTCAHTMNLGGSHIISRPLGTRWQTQINPCMTLMFSLKHNRTE